MSIAKQKACNVTAAFEGAGRYASLSGNFDGQGISFGFIQWNLGRGTLQPLLKAMAAKNMAEFRRCLTVFVPFYGKNMDLSLDLLAVCAMSPASAVKWAADRQDSGHRLQPQWTEAFKRLAAVPEFVELQQAFAKPYMDRAVAYVKAYGFKTERAVALMFDICVQMGSIGLGAKARYRLATVGRKLTEPQKLEAMARAIAPQGGKWAGDVLARKLCIAKGFGVVHGAPYNLAKDFGLTDAFADV